MRIVAGRYRSRRLKVGPKEGIRPTSDRLRETLFNILGDRVIESTFLDAYAGVGAIGIEALSRGARFVYFVDRDSKACAAVRANLESLEVKEGFRLLRMDLSDALRLCFREDVRFNIVFLDPPYQREDLYWRDLEQFGRDPLLEEGGLLIAEHSRAMEMPDAIEGLVRVRTRRQGDSVLTFYEPEA